MKDMILEDVNTHKDDHVIAVRSRVNFHLKKGRELVSITTVEIPHDVMSRSIYYQSIIWFGSKE